jgi:hypothetical protein
MLSSEEQMEILKEALLQGYQGPIFELIDEANVEAYQKQAQAAQQQSQETPSVGTPALGGEFEAKAPQSSTERNIIQPGQYKKGGIKLNTRMDHGGTHDKDSYNHIPQDSLINRQQFNESRFKSDAVSEDGATSIAQIMPNTFADGLAKGYVPKGTKYEDLAADDALAEKFQVAYMKDLLGRDWNKGSAKVKRAKSLAAYNMGPTGLVNHLNAEKRRGVDIYDSLDWVDGLGKEAREYVFNIMLGGDKEYEDEYNREHAKKFKEGGVKLSMGAEANHNCGPGIKKCGDTEGPVTLQRYTGLNYNTGNKNVGMDLDLGTQFSFGKDDTRSGAPVLQTGLSGNASMNIESFKNSNIDAAFDSGLDAYAKVGYKRKTNYGSADWDKPIPGFELGAYGNYDLLNKNINDVGVYGKYGAFTGNVGYNPQTKGGMLGVGLKFKEGGVRRYNHGGPHKTTPKTKQDQNDFINAYLQREEELKKGTTKSNSKTNTKTNINANKVSTTQGSYYYNKDSSPMDNKQVQAKNEAKSTDPTNPMAGHGDYLLSKDFGLDAAAVVNPIPDFIHAATKFDEGEYGDAAMYAGFGVLPFAAGPLVSGAKTGYNSLKSTLRNAWHTNPNPSSLIESMKLSDDVISQGTKDIKGLVTDNPNKLPVNQINENHITAVGDVGGLGPYMKPTDRHLVSVNIDGNTTVPMYRSTSFGGKPLVNEAGEVISSKGFYSPYLGSADVSGQMFNREGINKGWQVKQAGWDQGYGSDYLREMGFHLKGLDIQDTHKAMQNLTINEDAINPVAYNWDELTDWTKRKGGVRKYRIKKCKYGGCL